MSQIEQRQMLPIGTMLENRYRIVRYLASGGFGNTYVAEDSHFDNKKVAVKEFFMRGTNHRSTDGTTVEVSNDTNAPVFNTQLKKFQREAYRIFELRNNHIIHVSDRFDANGTSYYVMDLINGTSLADQTLSESEAHDVILQVLDALETMHAEGLYHLDVKPGNIMRDANGHCTLIDFGASKQLSADERNTLSSSTMAYTAGYAPLEQTAQQSKEIGPWTDFYALGATLYRLVTGTTPPEVSVSDSAPDGRKFPYPKNVSITMRHAISTLMNPIYTLRPQTTAEVRALLEGTYQPKEYPKPKEQPKPDEKPKPEKEPKPDEQPKPEETFLDNPSPNPTDEKTRLSSSTPHTSSSKGLWYGLAVLAAVVLLLIFVNSGGCSRKTPTPMVTDSVKAEEYEQISFKQCPDGNHPHLIDLGLPSGTLWACCNVGAMTPEDYGGYYAWGETEEKYEYNWETYQYRSDVNNNCQYFSNDIAGSQYDVAYAKWGSSWVMPSENQINELRFNCDYEWTTFRGAYGCKFTGPNGGSIFMPAAGWHKKDRDLVAKDSTCFYWSSTQDPNNCNHSELFNDFAGAATLHITPVDTTRCWVFFSSGLSVRPVAIIKAHTEAKEAVAEEAYKK